MSSLKTTVKSGLRTVTALGRGAGVRLRAATGRPPRFSGAFATRADALASLPTSQRAAYDRDDVAEVAYDVMTQVAPWDYPVLFWLDRCVAQTASRPVSVLDAGGHLGTKYSAFSNHLPMERFDWHVWDLPAILRAGRAWQTDGRLPTGILFADTPGDPGPVDVLLASGLMQYIDRSLGDLLAEMAAPPRWIILNKVAVRQQGAIVTLEQIGPARVPYQIRDAVAWSTELQGLGYEMRDSWTIPSLSHHIQTHPWLPPSESRGYMLERRTG